MTVKELMDELGDAAVSEPFVEYLMDIVSESRIGQERWGAVYVFYKDGVLRIVPSRVHSSEFGDVEEKALVDELLAYPCDKDELMEHCYNSYMTLRKRHRELVAAMSENNAKTKQVSTLIAKLVMP